MSKEEFNPKLRPCPFCGKIPELITGVDNLTKILCPEDSTCIGSGLFICFRTEDTAPAVFAWSTRAAPKDASVGQIYRRILSDKRQQNIEAQGLLNEIGSNTETIMTLRKLDQMDADEPRGELCIAGPKRLTDSLFKMLTKMTETEA